MIQGDQIRLRAPERSDVPFYVTWLNDPEVLQGLEFIPPLSTASVEKRFEDLLASSDKGETYMFVIEVCQDAEPESWKPVGNLGLINIDRLSRAAEFAIYIGEKAYRNQGYGTKATRLLLHYAFNTLNLNRIYLRVWETNPRAIRVYEKVGFVTEGRLRQAIFKEGRYIDVVSMAILSSEYKD